MVFPPKSAIDISGKGNYIYKAMIQGVTRPEEGKSPKGTWMSKKGEINKQNFELDFPGIKVLQYSYVEMRSSWNNPSRTAPYWRFYWNLTPGAHIVFQGRTIELEQDHILLIPPFTNYASFAEKPFFQLYMHFEWENPFPVTSPRQFSALPFKKQLLEVDKWFGAPGGRFELQMYAILLYYLAELQNPFPDEQPSKNDPRIEKALEIINDDLTLNNAFVAEKVRMSRDNFQRTFVRCMGITPCRYRISRRMELAQELLQDSLLTIDEIAQQTGFADRYQFSKAYKQFFKLPPGTARKKMHP